jgi:hypothetical protein
MRSIVFAAVLVAGFALANSPAMSAPAGSRVDRAITMNASTAIKIQSHFGNRGCVRWDHYYNSYRRCVRWRHCVHVRASRRVCRAGHEGPSGHLCG